MQMYQSYGQSRHALPNVKRSSSEGLAIFHDALGIESFKTDGPPRATDIRHISVTIFARSIR